MEEHSTTRGSGAEPSPPGSDHHRARASTPAGPLRTHFDRVRERRTDAEGQALLDEALARRRAALRHRLSLMHGTAREATP